MENGVGAAVGLGLGLWVGGAVRRRSAGGTGVLSGAARENCTRE